MIRSVLLLLLTCLWLGSTYAGCPFKHMAAGSVPIDTNRAAVSFDPAAVEAVKWEVRSVTARSPHTSESQRLHLL